MTTKKAGTEIMPVLKDSEAFKEIELTQEEIDYALMQARFKKAAEIKRKEYSASLKKEMQYPKYSAEQLWKLFLENSKFKVDDNNKVILWDLCLYFTEDERCRLDTKKGILLWGSVGCGKTTLMNFLRFNQSNSFAVISVRKISNEYVQHGVGSIAKYKVLLPSTDHNATFGQKEIGICFDDLGTEVDKKHFGNESNVMAEIILDRYDKHNILHGKTHITTNLSADEIGERYGDRVASRCKEMFNILTFPINSPDRRK